MRAECVHSSAAFVLIRNTHSVSDSESDADTESVVVDESAESVLGDAVHPNARLGTQSHFETSQTMLVDQRTNVVAAEEH